MQVEVVFSGNNQTCYLTDYNGADMIAAYQSSRNLRESLSHIETSSLWQGDSDTVY